jgi:tRNA(Ile)-lysidine synthase
MDDIEVNIDSGTYVVAVSGGVDSMVLLDILARKGGLNLVVAHLDHGIRQDSSRDRQLVQRKSKQYNLPFVYSTANLGPGASEAEARKVRYEFLRSVKLASNAKAIITAHQRDDIIETAILNIIRGTNRKGLSSLKSGGGLLRPIAHLDKDSLYAYAREQGIEWNEDSTNEDTNYRRNYVRHKILNRLNKNERESLTKIINKSTAVNDLIDKEVKDYLQVYSKSNVLDRKAFVLLPHSVAIEIMASWLRQNNIRDFDKKLLEILTVGAKTFRPNQRIDVNLDYFLEIRKDTLALINREC